MHEFVGRILNREFSTTRPQISVLIPISLQISIYCAHQSVCSYVKLSHFVKQRLLYVLLHNKRSLVSVDIRVLHHPLYLVQVLAHLNTEPSVCVLSWLHYPQSLAEFGHFIKYGSFIWILTFMVELLEFEELRIIESFLDMEGQGKVLEVVLA
jgi:hypothetical protein